MPPKVAIAMFIKLLMELINHLYVFQPKQTTAHKKDKQLFFSLVVVGLQATQANSKNNVNTLRAEAWLL
jgi:hypothetical protein